MTVTITDVRIHLNGITPKEVADDTIQQKIDDAEAFATELGVGTGSARDRFVRAWAAWRSFIVSRSYSQVRIGVVSVKDDLELKAQALKEEAQEALNEIADEFKATSTPMFDDRPQDPFELGEDPETVDQTKL